MTYLSRILPLALLVCVSCSLAVPSTQPTSAPSRSATQPNAALAPVIEDPSLPRVLLIGDSISLGYTLPVRQIFSGKANVLRPLSNCRDTRSGIKYLDTWLGSGKWDVIHFNFGLHDLKHVDDAGNAVDIDSGHRAVPLDEYQKNLEQIVLRLKRTSARLIWCTTTPVPPGAKWRRPGDEKLYNEAAARVMKQYNVVTDDLFSFARDHQRQWQLPANVHFTAEGYLRLAQQVSKEIATQLSR